MKLTIEAEIKSISIQTGVSKAGKEWKKANLLLALDENEVLQVHSFGVEISERIEDELNNGDIIKAEVNIGSREWDGRYFTDVSLLDYMLLEEGKGSQKEAIEAFERSVKEYPITTENSVKPFELKVEKALPITTIEEGGEDDLPF